MKYVRDQVLYSKKIKGKWYVLEQKHKAMRELNEVASLIWEMLEKPMRPASIAEEISRQFDVSYSQAEGDLQVFLTKYLKEGFVKRVP